MKLVSLFFCVLFITGVASLFTCSYAQTIAYQVALSDAVGTVKWIRQTHDGMLIVSGERALVGINPADGKIAWRQSEFKRIDPASFNSIEKLPFFTIDFKPLLASKRTFLLHAGSGEVVYDSHEDNLKLLNPRVLPSASSVLFEMHQEGENKVMLFDYTKQEPSWEVTLSKVNKRSTKEILTKQRFLTKPPRLIKPNRLLLVEENNVMVVDMLQGSVLWKADFKGQVLSVTYSPIDDNIYLGEGNRLLTYESETGKNITNRKLKLTGELVDISADSKGRIVVSSYNGFNLLDPTTARFVWRRSVGVVGLARVLEKDNMYYAMGKTEKNSSIVKINQFGKRLWDEKIKGQVYFTELVPSGVLYLSTKKANTLDFITGDELWEKSLKLKSIPAANIDESTNQVVLYEGEGVYTFDIESGKLEVLTEELDFDKTKGTVFQLEIRESGYFVHSDQHAALVDRSGVVRYVQYFQPGTALEGSTKLPAPNVDTNGLGLAVAGSLETIQALRQWSKRRLREKVQRDASTSSSSSVPIEPVYKITKTRYFNSKATKDNYFIVTKESAGNNKIIQLDKETGEVKIDIALKDKTPSYVIDEIDDRIYVVENNTTLSAYQMSK